MSRYLWAVGERTAAFNPGNLYANRYRYKGSRVFLDEHPAQLPGNFDEVPEQFIPYLKLSPNRIHIPQVYDWLSVGSTSAHETVLLLDQAPLYNPKILAERGIALPKSQIGEEVKVFPGLLEVWQEATPLRQLHWLWQMANLWHPMSSEGVISSLLTPELLRVEGPILRLLELRFDASPGISLTALGEFWTAQFVETAKPSIQKPLQQICQELSQGKVRNPDELISALDQSMTGVQGRSQQPRQLRVATLTDQGPSRQRNEDACFPSSGTVAEVPPAPPLVIVCDGIGGHQGGDVASNLAIKAIEQRMLSLNADRLDPTTLSVELEKAVCAANDLISQQNDSEQRFDRQRMGTTVVMGLVQAHQLYVTHVGDSRAYWITRWGCHQITQDDDVASREVRLGYSTYSQALQQPSSGSLVQALGMGNSTNLYPTVQRFIIDEDSVFLFCSDGLSDNDQVEKYWETTLLPLLDGKADLGTVGRWLIDIANTQNGYDNATVGILHCQVNEDAVASIPSSQGAKATPAPIADSLPPTSPPRETDTAVFAPGAVPLSMASTGVAPASAPTQSSAPTQKIEPLPSKRSKQPSLILSIAVLAMVAGAIVAAINWFNSLQPQTSQANPAASPSVTPQDPEALVPGSEPPLIIELASSERFRVDSAVLVASELQTARPKLDRQIQQGSIVYAVNQANLKNLDWLQLKVCAPPAAVSPSPASPSEPAPEVAPEAAPEVAPGDTPEVPSTEAESSLITINNPTQVADGTPNLSKAVPGSVPEENAQVQILPSEGLGWIRSDRYQQLQDVGSLTLLGPEDLSGLGETETACLSDTEPAPAPASPIPDQPVPSSSPIPPG
ncbi:MAG: hypothetical protein Kow00121_11430 [Elainellaceae cyanobacterium]